MNHIYLGKSNKSDPRLWTPIRFEIIQRLGNDGLSEWVGKNDPGDIYSAAAFVFATDAVHEFGVIGKGLEGQINTAFGNNVPAYLIHPVDDYPASVDELLRQVRFVKIAAINPLPIHQRDFITSARFTLSSEIISFDQLIDLAINSGVPKSANDDFNDFDDDWL